MKVQEKVLGKIKSVVESNGFEYVVQHKFTNVGTVYVMKDLDVVVCLNYNFQSDYATFQVFDNGVDVSTAAYNPYVKSFYTKYNKDLKEKILSVINCISEKVA